MMRTKIGTALDRELLKRARSMAVREGKQLSQIIEEALSEHLARKRAPKDSIVARTRGSLSLPKEEVDRILRDEPGLFDDIE
jgi:hypothetical protein